MSATLSPLTVVTGITIMVVNIVMIHHDGSYEAYTGFDDARHALTLDEVNMLRYVTRRNRAIIRAAREGKSHATIAHEVGMSRQAVWRVIRGARA